MSTEPNSYPIKLVRDNTAKLINPSGKPGDLWYDFVGNEGRMRLLKLKLSEEVGEYLVDGSWRELCDVLAVVEALGVAHGLSIDELLFALRSDPRGGFLDGLVMYGRHPDFDGQS